MSQINEPPVWVRDLSAHYGDRPILHDVNLRVDSGEIRVILGGSGSGKSTLLKHMMGLLTPSRGSVRVLGLELGDADEPELERLMSRIGVLFQASALLNAMSIADNVALPLREQTDLPESIIREMVHSKLSLVGLQEAAHLTPRELSGGMKKRAGLARAIALDPEVLFFDEPSAGLDPVTAAELDELILGLRGRFGMTMVVVTHELASIRRIADQVLMLAGGTVVADGPLQAVEQLSSRPVNSFFQRQPRGESEGPETLLAALHAAAGQGKTSF